MSKHPITVSVDKLLRKRPDGPAPRKLPADQRSCPKCQSHWRADELRRNMGVCLSCGHHFAVGARERLDQLSEGAPWQELWAELRASDPLQFVNLQPYPDRVERAEAAGGTEALVCAEIDIRDHRVRRGDHGLQLPRRQHGLGGGREARPRRRPLRRARACRWCASPRRAAPGCRRA